MGKVLTAKYSCVEYRFDTVIMKYANYITGTGTLSLKPKLSTRMFYFWAAKIFEGNNILLIAFEVKRGEKIEFMA